MNLCVIMYVCKSKYGRLGRRAARCDGRDIGGTVSLVSFFAVVPPRSPQRETQRGTARASSSGIRNNQRETPLATCRSQRICPCHSSSFFLSLTSAAASSRKPRRASGSDPRDERTPAASPACPGPGRGTRAPRRPAAAAARTRRSSRPRGGRASPTGPPPPPIPRRKPAMPMPVCGVLWSATRSRVQDRRTVNGNKKDVRRQIKRCWHGTNRTCKTYVLFHLDMMHWLKEHVVDWNPRKATNSSSLDYTGVYTCCCVFGTSVQRT